MNWQYFHTNYIYISTLHTWLERDLRFNMSRKEFPALRLLIDFVK